MPKIVDHEERRATLAEAVWRAILHDGVESVSIRRVAQEAGRTTGTVAHYFHGKADLMLFAFRLATRRSTDRMRKQLGLVDGPAGLRAALLEDMPIDEERRAEARVWLSFLGLAATRPELAQVYRQTLSEWQTMWVERLRAMSAAGQVRVDLAPEQLAERLIAFADSANIRATLDAESYSAERLVRLVDDFLAPLFDFRG